MTDQQDPCRVVLKLCPFCGGEPYSMPVFNSWGVACSEGCCRFEGESQEEAERRWNARPAPQVTEEQIVKLALDACTDEHAYGSQCSLSERDARRIAAALLVALKVEG
jgi:hypothetical protein